MTFGEEAPNVPSTGDITPPPSPSIAIFSSFRKHLEPVSQAAEVFRAHGIFVSNPPGFEPINPGTEFVRFPGDDPDMSDAEIQMRVIGTALLSSAIYVVCPGGYIGRTASYEIGWAEGHNSHLYFSEVPDPTERIFPQLAEGRIVSARQLADMVLQGQTLPINRAR